MNQALFPFKFYRKLRGFLTGKGLGRVPGISTLDKSINRRLRPREPFLVEAQGNKIYTSADEIGISVLTDSIWEAWETELFKKVVGEGMILVDIGAHVGYYTLIGARLVGKNGIVYAFEPDPTNYELLCKNINVNGFTNIVPVQKAVSNKCGKVKFWLYDADSLNHSLIEANVFRKSGFIEVETVTLDEFLETTIGNTTVDIILKMDTGGVEGLIVEAASKALRCNVKNIFMEYWPEGLKNAGTNPLELLFNLQESGFKLKFARDISNQRNTPLELGPGIKLKEFCKELKESQIFDLMLEKEGI